MSQHRIGYQHSNGSVEYIVIEWHQSTNELNRYLYDNYKTSGMVLNFIRNYTMEIHTFDSAHQYLTYEYSNLCDKYLYTSNNVWYVLSRSFILHFPKKLSVLLHEFDNMETENMIDSMENMEL